MLPRLTLFLSFTLLTSACSLYSSAGRKRFEDKAPSEPQAQATSFSLLGCRELSSAEAWLREEFPSSNSELVEMNPDYEVWAKTTDSASVEVTVLTKKDIGSTERPQSCTYEFESKATWLNRKKAFITELANSLVDLD
jgi:hypothetical protein